MKVKISVNGIDRAISFGDLIVSNVAQAIEREVDRGAKEVRDMERSLAPKKTGGLVRGIGIRRGKYGISKMVRAKAPHSHLQEYGTKRGVTAKKFSERTRQAKASVIEARIRAAIAREVKG